MADLTTLLERVEKATGPDLELDSDIYAALDQRPKSGPFPTIPNYTASIDAAVALVEKAVQPWEVHAMFNQAWGRSAWSALHDGKPISETLARNLVAAKLRALIAKDKTK